MFEEEFRADVLEIDKSLESMIWRIMSRFAELTGEPQQMTPAVIYAVFDGLFQQCLLKHLAGDPQAIGQYARSMCERYSRGSQEAGSFVEEKSVME